MALRLILPTLLRKSELMLARWEHVDVDKAEWHIPAENSKTGKPRIVYLSPQALALFAELRSLAGGSELVLPGRVSLNKPFAHNAMNNALKVALRGQDIPAFTLHDLRRTASTLLHEHGWPADVVEKAPNRTKPGGTPVLQSGASALDTSISESCGIRKDRRLSLGRCQ